MTAEFSRLRRIVERALDLPAEERAGWLEEACGGDGKLLQEARDLLLSADAETSFLTPPAPPEVADPVLPELFTIGSYKLLRVVASGGMGTVYEGEQRTPRRRAAVKVMRTGLGGVEAVARFRYEVQVLANLRHPNIAHMYESGVHVVATEALRTELPWFAMEFVEDARPITAWAREEGLSLRRRIDLFGQVCEAIQHGHTKGVIHRDVKPDNVLVGRDGRPKVIDFGVARALHAGPDARTLRTHAGAVLGTLSYMSPEQAAGRPDEVDARSDVYSLGVLLFELLTDALPHDLSGKGLVESARIILEEPPARPSKLAPRVDGDLQAIVLRCLSKEPGRRYESAAALRDDLRRYLAHEPIEARPPSVPYQLRKFIRRHRIAVSSATMVVLVLVAATVVSLRSLREARKSAKLAGVREEQATRARDRARGLFETVLSRSVAEAFDLAPEVRDLPGGAPLSREMIADAIADLEVLLDLAGDEPEVRLQIGLSYLRLGDVQGNPSFPNLGDRAAAMRSYERAAEIADGLESATPPVRRLVAMCDRKRGEMELVQGRLSEAREFLDRSLATLDRALGVHPGEFALLTELATAHDKRAVLAGRMSDLEGLARHTRRYAKIYRELARERPDDEALRFQVALSHQQVAGVHYRREEMAEAIAEWQSSLPVLEALSARHPENTAYRLKIAWARMWIGTSQQNLGRLEAAGDSLRAALRTYLDLVEGDPTNDQYPVQLGNLYWMLGRLAEVEAAPERAIGRYREALTLFEGLEREGRLPARQSGAPAMIREKIEEVRRLAEGEAAGD